jgi:hypothetical protein
LRVIDKISIHHLLLHVIYELLIRWCFFNDILYSNLFCVILSSFGANITNFSLSLFYFS